MSYKEKIKNIFKNTYIEINKNHDEAINTFKNFNNIKNTKIKTLVNYDSHSDLYVNTKHYSINMANWVNFAFSKLEIEEYYWIIPNYIISNPILKNIFTPNEKLHEKVLINGPMRAYGKFDNIIKEKFLLNKITNEIITTKKINMINQKNKKFSLPEFTAETEGLAEISIYIVPIDKLSILKGKEIALSIDADAFCNSGHNTVNSIINNFNITSDELKKEFELFINKLYENNLNIISASLTRSPAHFPNKFEKELYDFFETIKSASNF